MTLIHPFFSYHTGAVNNAQGIREHWERLAAAGIPIITTQADGFLLDAQIVAQAHPELDHVIIFRRTVAHNGSLPPSGDPSVPDYNKDPALAAADHVAWTIDHLPPELDPAVVYISDTNEPDKNRADWLYRYALEADKLYKAAGYRYAALGWACGEPELYQWTTQAALDLMERLEVERGRFVLTVHEYAFNQESIWSVPDGQGGHVPVATPEESWLVGRFARVLDRLGPVLGRAWRGRVVFKEFGWELDNVPAWPVMANHLANVMDFYAPRPQVEGAAIWYLGPGFGGINQEVQATIAPLTDWATQPGNVWERPSTPPPPGGQSLEAYLWEESKTEQEERGVWINPRAGLVSAIRKDGLIPVHREIYPKPGGGPAVPIQAAEHGTLGTRWLYLWEDGRPRRWRPQLPPVKDYDPELWAISVQEQENRGIRLNRAAALQRAIVGAGLWPVHSEITRTWTDGQRYTVQAGEAPITGTRWLYIYQPGKLYRWRPDAPPPPPPPPPPGGGETVNLAAGFMPSNGDKSVVFDLQNGRGDQTTTTETCQLRVRDGRIYMIKNGNPEQIRLWTDPAGKLWVERGADYSMGADQLYELIDPYRTHWSRWSPGTGRVGEIYERTARIRVYRKGDCSLVTEYTETTYLYIEARLATWDPSIAGVHTGPAVPGVTVAQFRATAGGPWVERYYIADGLYLAGWDHADGRWTRFMRSYPERPDLPFPDLGCANWIYTI